MKYSIYICDNCHTWQPPPVAESLNSLFDTIKGISTNANFTPKPLEVSCSKGCGRMREVTTEDKIALFKQPSGFVVFPPDYTFAECMRHQKELRAESAQREKLLEDVYALLKEYAETFPWETELKDRADSLLARIVIVPPEKEPAKKQETYSFMAAIDEARNVQGYSVPSVITNGQIIVRCQFAEGSHYILFKGMDCIGMCRHIDEAGLDLSKGWYPAGEEDTKWANAQSLGLLEYKLEAFRKKKQEESTALFDVIGKAVLQHSGRVFTAQNSWDDVIAVYRVISNTWELTTAISSSKDPTALTQDALQSLAKKYQINLSKGWRMVNVSGVRG